MQQDGTLRRYPQLKQMVAEASRALAQLDSARLEELAVCCKAFNRELGDASPEDWGPMAEQSREAAAEMGVLVWVLEATRSNLNVMNRLREKRAGRIEYSERQARGWVQAGNRNGDD